MRTHLVLAASLALGLAPAGSAFASSVPPAAQTERAGTAQAAGKLTPLTTQPPQLETAVPLLARPEGAAQMTLTVTDIILENASVFTAAELAAYWQDLTGKPIPLSALYDLCDTLTRHYRAAGYVLAQVTLPAQELGHGPARLQVNEGRIAKVSYEGPFADSKPIRKVLQRLEQLKVLNLPQAEHGLLLLNDLPGLNFKLLLLPSSAEGIQLTVVGEQEPRLSGTAQFDNSGSRYLGPYLLGGSVELANLFGTPSLTTLSLNGALQVRELASLALSHTLPLGLPELQLTTELQATRGEPGYTLKSSDIDSRSLQAAIRADYTLVRQRDAALVLSAGLQLRNATTDLLGTRLSHDAARNATLTVRYDWGDRLGGQSLAQLELAQGLSGFLGGSETNDADLSRSRAQTDATWLNLTLLRNQSLGRNFSLFGALRAQIADSALLAGDEFGYGGSFMGRAYDPSEMTGDSGLSGLVELRSRVLEAKALQLQPFVFADYGVVWNRDAGQPSRDEGASAGLGLLATYKATESRLTLAQPLLESSASTYPNNPGPRLLFSLQSKF